MNRRITDAVLRLMPGLYLGLLGCSVGDQASPLVKHDRVSVLQTPEVRPSEQRFEQIAQQVEGFGGYYYDDTGNLVAYLMPGAIQAQARVALAGVLADFPPQKGNGNIIFRQADFTFAELANWRSAVTDQILGSNPAVLSVDADEVRNRVSIGLSDLSKVPQLRAEIVALGIPEGAVRFEQALPTYRQDTLLYSFQIEPSQPGTTVRSFAEPAPGGAQIAFVNASTPANQEFVCTLGYPIKSGSVIAARGDSIFLLTASHCSYRTFEYDGQSYYQPDVDPGVPDYFLGNEVFDPHYFICCVAHYHTRYSDALLADVRGSSRHLLLGRVWKTTGFSVGRTSGTPGSLTVDQNDPYFYVVRHESSVPVGYTVSKIGRTTGWTRGSVNATCVDKWIANLGEKRLCNTQAYYWSDGGDSGAPVFIELGGNQVAAVGIHWGAFGSNGGRDGSAVFSTFGNMERSDELGPIILP